MDAMQEVSSNGAAARDMAGAAADGRPRQFITFTIGAEEYGVDIMAVREIKGWTETTILPQSPPHVRGVINLRGVIVPIYDLRARFGMGSSEPTKSHVVIIVAVRSRVVGLLVDGVSDILTVETGAVRAVPELDRRGDADFLDGLVALDTRMVTLISLDRLFRGERSEAEVPTQ